jgi:drug/metabolite transporter (DMT)-like permease
LIGARLAALGAVVLWGISFVATKAAVSEISPITLVTLRAVLGVLFLVAVLTASRTPILAPRRELLMLALMGFVGVFVHQMLQAIGLTMTSAINTGWLIVLIPIWSAILSSIFRGERFGRFQLLGLVLGLAGAVLVVTRGSLSANVLALPSTRGDMFIVASTLNWAIYTILGHGTIKRLGARRATTLSMMLGGVMLLPIFLATGGWKELDQLSRVGWAAVFFLGVGSSGLGYLLWYGALRHIEAGRVAAFIYIEPLVTLATAMAFLGESVTATTIAGGALVLLGVLLVQRRAP